MRSSRGSTSLSPSVRVCLLKYTDRLALGRVHRTVRTCRVPAESEQIQTQSPTLANLVERTLCFLAGLKLPDLNFRRIALNRFERRIPNPCHNVSEAVRDWAFLAVHLGPPLSLLHEDLRTVLAVKGLLRRATPARP